MNNINDYEDLWTPCEDLLSEDSDKNYAVIILHCPINVNIDPRRIISLWEKAKLRITVDGGTRRWLDWLEAHLYAEPNTSPPDLITGDLDSLSPVTLKYFESRGTKIIKTPDQEETDYTKSLKQLKQHCSDNDVQIDVVFAFGDTSGRFDHILANINTLFKASKFLPDKKVYNIASNSITWLLTPGDHRISIPEKLRKVQEWCALIPIGSACIASSTGLKWNLDNTKLSFGELVSSSNTYSGEPFVTIHTKDPIVWSMGIKGILKCSKC